MGARPGRRSIRPGRRRQQLCRPRDERAASSCGAHRRRGSCDPPGRERADGAGSRFARDGAGAAQRCREHFAQPRHPTHREHARSHHRHADERYAHQQHQAELHRTRRDRRRNRRPRFGRDEGTLGLRRRECRLPRDAQREHAQHEPRELDDRIGQRDLARSRQRGAERLRKRNLQRHQPDPGRLRPRHPCGVDRSRPRDVLRTHHARHHRCGAERQHLRRQGARRLGGRHAERRARRHSMGHLSRTRIQHPGAQREPGQRLDRELAHRPAVHCAAQCHGCGRHRRRCGRQLRPRQLRARGVRTHRLARPRSFGHHRWKRQLQGHGRTRRRQRE